MGCWQTQQQRADCADPSQGSPSSTGLLNGRLGPAYSSPLGSSNYHSSAYSGNNSHGDEDDDSEDQARTGLPPVVISDNHRPATNNKKVRHKSGTSKSCTKLLAEPLYEEDVVDGFAIFSFTSYDDLEVRSPLATCKPTI